MTGYGKLLGAFLGFILLKGWIGAIIGFFVGSYVDTLLSGNNQQRTFTSGRTARESVDFGSMLLHLIAAIMKADGKILSSELNYVKAFYRRQFGDEYTKNALIKLRSLLESEIKVDQICGMIRIGMDPAAKLQLLHLLYGLAAADGNISDSESQLIYRMAIQMGIPPADHESIKAMFVKEAGSAYRILEISETASDDEVKKAFRKMAVKYHPDKVSHLGEEYKTDAADKFRKVKDAYETIKKQRGIK